MAVSNEEHRLLGAAARRAFNKIKHRQPDVEYPVTVRDTRLVMWTNTGSNNAMLNLMFATPDTDGLSVTYLQVRKDGVAVRNMVRHGSVSELERWFRHYPEDRKALSKRKVT